MRPVCQFCKKVIQEDQRVIHEADRGIYDNGWTHELCWWKRECARLTAVIAELKSEPDGSYTPLPSHRDAKHSFGSLPTQFAEEDK